MVDIGLACIIGYLLGSIPFGVLIARFRKLGDLRKIGSGNIGATNVLRTGHKGLAALTLTLDIAKGAAAYLIVNEFLGTPWAYYAALAAVIGHIFPVWLRFNGGKGVATSYGVLLAMNGVAGLMAITIWIAVALTTRYSSLAALISLSLAPLLVYWQINGSAVWLAAILALTIWITHYQNIKRLLSGSEGRIGK